MLKHFKNYAIPECADESPVRANEYIKYIGCFGKLPEGKNAFTLFNGGCRIGRCFANDGMELRQIMLLEWFQGWVRAS